MYHSHEQKLEKPVMRCAFHPCHTEGLSIITAWSYEDVLLLFQAYSVTLAEILLFLGRLNETHFSADLLFTLGVSQAEYWIVIVNRLTVERRKNAAIQILWN